MLHRISAGAIVEHDDRVLLVRHNRPGHYDFWVCPGGGVRGDESLDQAAVREVREETGLEVRISKLLYVEELISPECRYVKFWFAGQLIGGEPSAAHPEAIAEYITQACWVSPTEFGQGSSFRRCCRASTGGIASVGFLASFTFRFGEWNSGSHGTEA